MATTITPDLHHFRGLYPQAKDKNGFPIQFGDLEATLNTFNRIHENEGNTSLNGLFTGSGKRNELNLALKHYGFPPIPEYKIAEACNNRRVYTLHLNAGDYPGVILGSSSGPCPNNRPGH